MTSLPELPDGWFMFNLMMYLLSICACLSLVWVSLLIMVRILAVFS